MEPETAAFGYLARALVLENSGPCSKEPLAIRDMRRFAQTEFSGDEFAKVILRLEPLPCG